MKDGGYLLNDVDGHVTPANADYQEPDPIVTLLLIILDAATQDYFEKLKDQVEDLAEGEITLKDFIELRVQATPGLRILQDFRDKLIPTDDTGEIARLIRDPIKRPIEIVKNIRDGVIDPEDNGEIARFIRDPGKRAVEVIGKIFSDIRLKRDILFVRHLDSGVGLYRYRYLWNDQYYLGVIAQEVAAIQPDAVECGPDGYLRVDYGQLGLEHREWSENETQKYETDTPRQ